MSEPSNQKEIALENIIFPSKSQSIRDEIKDVEGIAISFMRHDQKYPIIVEEISDRPGYYMLVDGRHRVLAAKKLGWKTIKAIYSSETNTVDRMLLEYTLNKDRNELSWQELAKAEYKIHQARVAQYGARLKGCIGGGGWGLDDTAKAFNRSAASVSQDLDLAKAIQEHPQLANCRTRNEAIRMLRKIKDGSLVPEETVKKLQDQISQVYLNTNPYEFFLRHDPFATAVITDITGEENLEKLISLLTHIALDNADIWLFSHSSNLFNLIPKFRELGLMVDGSPFICQFKNENDAYVQYLWCSKKLQTPPEGVRRIMQFKRDGDFIHRCDIPSTLVTHLLNARVTAVGSPHNVVDPFAYGGMVAQAAMQSKCNVLSTVLDEEIFKLGKERLLRVFLPTKVGSGTELLDAGGTT